MNIAAPGNNYGVPGSKISRHHFDERLWPFLPLLVGLIVEERLIL